MSQQKDDKRNHPVASKSVRPERDATVARSSVERVKATPESELDAPSHDPRVEGAEVPPTIPALTPKEKAEKHAKLMAAYGAVDLANEQLADANLDQRVIAVWNHGRVVFQIIRFVVLENDIGDERVHEIANPPELTEDEKAEAERQEAEATAT